MRSRSMTTSSSTGSKAVYQPLRRPAEPALVADKVRYTGYLKRGRAEPDAAEPLSAHHQAARSSWSRPAAAATASA